MTWKNIYADKSQDHGSYYPLDNEEKKNSNVITTSIWLLCNLWIFGSITSILLDEAWLEEDLLFENGTMTEIHSRSKRFVYMASDRRLNLPPGSILGLESTWSLPGFHPLPAGLSSETAISIPFHIEFDALGWTSQENTFGEIPFMDRIWEWTEPLRNLTNRVFLPNPTGQSLRKEGDDRVVIYQVIEDALDTMGINGKACLLRTICEIHLEPIFGHGIFGEFLELLLSVTSSTNYLHQLNDYLKAEARGKNFTGCEEYLDKCPLSLFSKFTEEEKKIEEEIRENFINTENVNIENIDKYEKKRKKKYRTQNKDFKEHFKKPRIPLKVLSREKRFIFFGPSGRLRLPPGAIFIIKPELRLPVMRNIRKVHKHLHVGFPLKVTFDDLGLTSVLNPFMTLPFFSNAVKKKREAWRPLPGVNYSGGDRELIFTILEHALNSWDLDGRGCLLRAICETHLQPLDNYGFFGEVFRAFLSPSRSSLAEYRLKEYLEAEFFGRDHKYCRHYLAGCPYSLFKTSEEINEVIMK